MPPPSIPLLPEGQASDFTKYKNRLDFSAADAWKSCADAIEQHDADECKAHREEIDTLLVFAGLFSAVLTAFAIESYQWLQDDPNDAIIALLSQLAQTEGANHSAPAPTGLPGAVSVRINAYWFLSLTLSLSAALVAILCKQWVREFERHSNQSHRQYIGIRQMKLEGFEGWGVASIVMAIPLLLQSALGLFALGLIELLWNLHSSVALVVLVPTAAALLFYALTSLLPGLQVMYIRIRPSSTLPQCPFKSPQSTLALRVIAWLQAFATKSYNTMVCLLKLCLSGLSAAGYMLCILFRCTDSAAHLRDMSEDHMEGLQVCYKSLRTFRGPYYSESWSALDAELNKARDSYDSSDRVALPPSLFRGLTWLLDHIDQPGMTLKICLAAWDIVTTADGAYRVHPRSRLRYGLLSLSHTPNKLTTLRDVAPILYALQYAKAVGFHNDFLVELIIQYAARVDRLSAARIFEGNVILLDEETRHALLRAILVRGAEMPEIHDLLLIAARSLGASMSRQELACVISVYFRALYSRTEDVPRDRHQLQKLFRIAARCLEVGDGRHADASATRHSAEVQRTLCALVVEIDQRLHRLTMTYADYIDHFDYNFVVELLTQRTHRDVYIGLLASAENGPVNPPGDMSAAETRFEQTVGRLARRGREVGMLSETSLAAPTAALDGIQA